MKTPAEKHTTLKTISYKIFGNIAPKITMIKTNYTQSGIKIWYESYISIMLFSAMMTFILTLAAGIPIQYLLLKSSLTQIIPATLALATSLAITTIVIFLVYPIYCTKQRKNEIDTNLVYTTGYMSALATGGISIEKIFDRVNQVETHKPIKDLAKQLITNVNVFGLDIVAALKDINKHTPSDVFSKLITGIINTIKTSGDLKSLLTFETESLLTKKREEMKKTLNALLGLGEVYIAGVVMGPVTFIIMITILSVMGSSGMGISSIFLLNLLVFFGIPAICLVFIVVLNSALPSEK